MPNTTESGFKERILGRVKEDRYGRMDRCTKAGGKTTKPTEKGDSSTQMAMFMMDSGRTIRRMDMVFTVI